MKGFLIGLLTILGVGFVGYLLATALLVATLPHILPWTLTIIIIAIVFWAAWGGNKDQS